MDKAYLKRASTVAKVIFGNVFYAFVIKLFLLPGNLMTGGTTGIGLVVKHFTGASISGFVLAFNIVMLIVGICTDDNSQFFHISNCIGSGQSYFWGSGDHG